MIRNWHVFLINPAAGPKSCENEVKKDIGRYFSKTKNHKVTFFTSKKQGDIKTEASVLTRLAEVEGFQLFLYACGGDGTLNEVVNGVMSAENHEHVAITHIPRGSGNDFVKNFSNPAAFFDISSFSADKSIQEIDVDLIKVNSRYCINICSFGFDARIGTDVSKFRRSLLFSKKSAYVASAVHNTFKGIEKNMIIRLETTDGEKISLNQGMTLACFCNGGWYGGGFHPIPEADINDGILDALLVRGTNRLMVAALIKEYGEGNFEKLGNLAQNYHIRCAKIITNELEPVNIDGELMMSGDTTIEIVPKAIKFFAPKSTWIK